MRFVRTTVAPPAPPARPVTSRRAASTAARTRAAVCSPWGWAPAISVIAALGVALVTFAYERARAGAPLPPRFFFTGLLLITVPSVVRLLLPGVGRRESVTLTVLVGLLLYVVSFLHGPLGVTSHDEFLHWRIAADILSAERLFSDNPLLPAGAYFPTLEILTTALARLSGLSIYISGVLVIGAGKLVLLLAFFVLFERVSGSARVGALATVLYTANANYLFFDSTFSYESIAIPLAAALLVLAYRAQQRCERPLVLLIATPLFIISVVVGHHMTSLVFALFLVAWTLITIVYRLAGRRDLNAVALALITLLFVGAIAAWLAVPARPALGYLGPILEKSTASVVRLVKREESQRQLFATAEGDVAPLADRALALGAAVSASALLPFALLLIWLRRRRDPTALALAAAGGLYPVTLAMRLSGGGSEMAARSVAFVFVGVGFALGYLLVALCHRRWRRALLMLPLGAVVGVIFMGNLITGMSPWIRFPGPFMVNSDDRSVNKHGIAMAQWMRDYRGIGQRVVADRINVLMLGSYGQQRPITSLRDGIGQYISDLYFAPEFGSFQRQTLDIGGIRYIVVDSRLSSQLPKMGFYFDEDERILTEPIRPARLEKFDSVPQLSRVFDDGVIRVYDAVALPPAEEFP